MRLWPIAGVFLVLALFGALAAQDRSSSPLNTSALLRAEATIEADCDRSYPTVCIPHAPPDLNCDDVPYEGFPVRAPDRHGFDNDGDGIGCEEYWP